MLRRLRPPLVTAGGLATASLIDRALTPRLKPLSTVAASATSVGSVQLFQYDICPFCNKLKALLDLHRVPYDTTEVNPLTKSEIKSWSGGYKKVPIAMLGGEQVNDSPVIAQELIQRIAAAGVMTPEQVAEFNSPKAKEWAKWSDEKFAVRACAHARANRARAHARPPPAVRAAVSPDTTSSHPDAPGWWRAQVLLFPNITRSFGEAYETFGYVMSVPHFSYVDKWSNQLVGAFFMWLAQGKIKKKYAIDDERAAVIAGVEHWLSEGVGKATFAGGEKPNLADVCVFGCLKAIDRTTAFQEIMRETEISPWYERMREVVQPGQSCAVRQ